MKNLTLAAVVLATIMAAGLVTTVMSFASVDARDVRSGDAVSRGGDAVSRGGDAFSASRGGDATTGDSNTNDNDLNTGDVTNLGNFAVGGDSTSDATGGAGGTATGGAGGDATSGDASSTETDA